MKRILTIVGVIAASLALGVPAAADAPAEFTDVDVFQEPDPCDPDVLMTTTLTFDVRVHEHRSGFVATASFTATTDTGYSGSGQGHNIFIINPEVHFSDVLTAMVTNADGDRYKVNAIIVGNPNGVAADIFNIRCIRGN